MGYYSEKLAGERLRRCYEIAPPRVRRYLSAEIEFILSRIETGDSVLELGCGYGRVVFALAGKPNQVVGIDTAEESLRLARSLTTEGSRYEFLNMEATCLDFMDDRFDVVLCIQNGICAFGVDRRALVRESLRVTRPGGRIIFSSYSPKFWQHRLEWFRLQSEAGLLGEIDTGATGNGVIVCKDGFRAGAMDSDGFLALAEELGVVAEITEVDDSVIFCEFSKEIE